VSNTARHCGVVLSLAIVFRTVEYQSGARLSRLERGDSRLDRFFAQFCQFFCDDSGDISFQWDATNGDFPRVRHQTFQRHIGVN